MMSPLKSLLVHLDGTARAETRLRLALQLAGDCDARVSALFAVAPLYPPVLPMPGGAALPLAGKIDLDHRIKAMGAFERARGGSKQACEWLELAGEPVTATFARRALSADLLFLGQRDPGDAQGFDVPADFVESVLIDGGRPALVIPYAGAANIAPKTVLIAWKSTREAAHAVTAALHFLRGAKQVHLVDHDDDETQAAPVQVREYLRRHGVAQVHEQARLSERHAGEDLLSLAADCGAEMIVMGCYGHSRARELVLGGATRTLLQSMTVPVLMAH